MERKTIPTQPEGREEPIQTLNVEWNEFFFKKKI